MSAAEALPLPDPPADDSAHVQTPAGIEVYYESQPRRFYLVNGVEVPSVTTILGCLSKDGLPWWGMKTGVDGVLELAKRGAIRPFESYFTAEIVKMLTENKLTVNHVRDRAGDRGLNVHDAFELWAITGTTPERSDFPEAEQGYIDALNLFLEDAEIYPERTEVMVGSVRHRFAGRYDLRAQMGECELVTKLTKTGAVTSVIPAGAYIEDVKTSSGIYLEHFLQLEGYEGASVECGYASTDYRAVIHLCADGRYEFVLSKATFGDFLAVRGAYEALQALKARQK